MAFIPKTFSATKDITNLNTAHTSTSLIRIAIYDESNVTLPSYALGTTSVLTNDYANIQAVLTSAGYKVSILSGVDISNHKLTTASFDVFIMVDNLPRENITNYIKEFWLGGGAILSFDSTICFLCYAGMLPPDAEGTNGYGTYWTYASSTIQNITLRHPVSKSYYVGDAFSVSTLNWAVFNWANLLGTSIADNLYKIATRIENANSVSVIAYEPSNVGGKVIHILTSVQINATELIKDAVDWLCPKPKGRILFDLSHHPYYGIDPWDVEYVNFANRYPIMRNDLVSRSYNIDKFYLGNYTAANLAPYDILIIVLPSINFTANEVAIVQNWISQGGSLLVFGDNIALSTQIKNNNYLLSGIDLAINTTTDGANLSDYNVDHPTLEGCTQLTMSFSGLLVVGSSAFPIWGNNEVQITVACQELGEGRIILASDINFIEDSNIGTDNNEQYMINMINWLTADDAEILIYVHNPSNPDPNDNIYRGPVANALNDLGRSFYMTFTKEYLNLSLSTGSYKLVVIDNSEFSIMDTVGMTLLNFLKTGGYLIISTYEYRLATYNYLWDYIGIAYAGNYFTTPQSINIWNPTHPIFSSPAQYSTSTLETSLDFVNTDYTNLTLHSNATAIAGLTLTPNVNGSAIILGANNHVITNAMHLTEYFDDTDDDTYPDALQLWKNEIAYMWAQILPHKTSKIPSYDIFIILGSIFVLISLISLVIIKKRKNIII